VLAHQAALDRTLDDEGSGEVVVEKDSTTG
jgi:hypothetical protein